MPLKSTQTTAPIPGVEHVTCQSQANHLHHLYHLWKDLLGLPLASPNARITASIALLRDAISGRHLAFLATDLYPSVTQGYWRKLLFYGQQALHALAFTITKVCHFETKNAKPAGAYPMRREDALAGEVPRGGDVRLLRQWAMTAYLDLQHVTAFFGEVLDAAKQGLGVCLGDERVIWLVEGRKGPDAVRTPGLEGTVAVRLPPVPEEEVDATWEVGTASSMVYCLTNLAAVLSRAFEGADVKIWGHTVPPTEREMMLRLKVPEEWKIGRDDCK